MALLTLVDVHKSYDPKRPLLRGAELVVEDRERLGLVGANGSGKSTLLKILAGVEQPDAGERRARRGIQVAYLPQEPVLPEGRSAKDAVLAGLAARRRPLEEGAVLDHLAERRLAELGVRDSRADCAHLSGGEKRRVALARLLVGDPDLLLLDEPTNHLDAQVSAFLEQWLERAKLPFVMITHDRYFLDRVVDRIVEVDDGVLHSYPGRYRDYVEQRAARLQARRKAEQSRVLLLRRETEWIRRGPPARGTKAKARIRRYEELQAPLHAEAAELELRIPPGPRLGDKVLRFENLSMSRGGRRLFADLDFVFQRGTRLGIVGPNGAGKSTLLDLCTGALEPESGSLVVGPTVRFSRVGQEREELDPNESVLESVAGGGGHVRTGERVLRVEGFLDRFLFPGEHKQTLVRDLSGGERARVLLARLLCAGGNFLLLDEPTNDLDLPTLRALEEALLAFEGAAILVSHDRWFLDRVATDVLALDGRGSARQHVGDLSALLEQMAAARRSKDSGAERGGPSAKPVAGAGSAGGSARPASAAAPRRRKRTYKEERELEALPEAIAALESERAALDARLADPKSYAEGGADVAGLTARRAELEREIASRYARWEELEDIGGEAAGPRASAE